MKTPTLFLLILAALVMSVAVVYQFGLNWKTGLPLVISVLSLCVSGCSFWISNFSPFNLHIGIGNRVHLFRNPSLKLEPLIKLPVIFANSGAVGGLVSDIAIEIRKKGDEGQPFIAACTLEETKRDLHLGNPAAAPSPQMTTFNGVFLNAGESKTMMLCFLVYWDTTTDQGDFEYAVGEYSVTVLTREVNQTGWTRQGATEFSIDDLDMHALAKPTVAQGGAMVNIYERIVMATQHTESVKSLIKRQR